MMVPMSSTQPGSRRRCPIGYYAHAQLNSARPDAFVGLQVKCWALSRSTFRKVLSGSAFERRRRFGELLDKASILEGLSCAARRSHPLSAALRPSP